MANEIKQTVGVQCINGNLNVPRLGTTRQINQAAVGGPVPGTITAVTTGQGTAVSTTGLSTPGVTYIKNLDPTNYVEFGPLSGGTLYPLGRLYPGEEATFRLGGSVALNVRANTASCKVLVQILES